MEYIFVCKEDDAMKKYVFILVCFLSFAFTSCSGYSADEILSFGNRDFEMSLCVEFDGREYDVVVKKEGERYNFLVDDNYIFVYDSGSWRVISGKNEFFVSNDAFSKSLAKKTIDVIMANSLSAWKITLDERNGDRIFLCDCVSNNVLISVDAETKFPVGFSDDGISAVVKLYRALGEKE